VGLDLLRMAAAMMVLSGHLTYVLWIGKPNPPVTAHIMEPFVWFGWVGVEIFFVISGFVIAYSAVGIVSNPATAPRAHTVFFQHRLKRLFPAAVICASFTATLNYFDGSQTLIRAIASWIRTLLFLPQAPIPILRLPFVDFSYWTLTIEVIFYALIYLLLRFKRFDLLSRVMGGVGLASTLFWIAYFVTLDRSSGAIHWHLETPLSVIAQITLLINGCYFALGVFLWKCLFQSFTWKRITMLCICMIGGILQIIERWNYYTPQVAIRIPATLAVVVWAVAVALIILFTRGNAPLQHLLGRRGVTIARRLGLMTYPLYLLHQQFGVFLILHIRTAIGDWMAIIFAASSALILAYLVSVYLEPPAQRLLGRFVQSRSTTPVTPGR
jgi:peptidoglycan/LPS O-acetylase OafA/YrhL